MAYISLKRPETTLPTIAPSKLTLAALTSLSVPFGLTRQWRQRASERRHLSRLNDHVLADLGLTRQEVIDEAAKPFWRPLGLGSGR